MVDGETEDVPTVPVEHRYRSALPPLSRDDAKSYEPRSHRYASRVGQHESGGVEPFSTITPYVPAGPRATANDTEQKVLAEPFPLLTRSAIAPPVRRDERTAVHDGGGKKSRPRGATYYDTLDDDEKKEFVAKKKKQQKVRSQNQIRDIVNQVNEREELAPEDIIVPCTNRVLWLLDSRQAAMERRFQNFPTSRSDGEPVEPELWYTVHVLAMRHRLTFRVGQKFGFAADVGNGDTVVDFQTVFLRDRLDDLTKPSTLGGWSFGVLPTSYVLVGRSTFCGNFDIVRIQEDIGEWRARQAGLEREEQDRKRGVVKRILQVNAMGVMRDDIFARSMWNKFRWICKSLDLDYTKHMDVMDEFLADAYDSMGVDPRTDYVGSAIFDRVGKKAFKYVDYFFPLDKRRDTMESLGDSIGLFFDYLKTLAENVALVEQPEMLSFADTRMVMTQDCTGMSVKRATIDEKDVLDYNPLSLKIPDDQEKPFAYQCLPLLVGTDPTVPGTTPENMRAALLGRGCNPTEYDPIALSHSIKNFFAWLRCYVDLSVLGEFECMTMEDYVQSMSWPKSRKAEAYELIPLIEASIHEFWGGSNVFGKREVLPQKLEFTQRLIHSKELVFHLLTGPMTKSIYAYLKPSLACPTSPFIVASMMKGEEIGEWYSNWRPGFEAQCTDAGGFDTTHKRAHLDFFTDFLEEFGRPFDGPEVQAHRSRYSLRGSFANDFITFAFPKGEHTPLGSGDNATTLLNSLLSAVDMLEVFGSDNLVAMATAGDDTFNIVKKHLPENVIVEKGKRVGRDLKIEEGEVFLKSVFVPYEDSYLLTELPGREFRSMGLIKANFSARDRKPLLRGILLGNLKTGGHIPVYSTFVENMLKQIGPGRIKYVKDNYMWWDYLERHPKTHEMYEFFADRYELTVADLLDAEEYVSKIDISERWLDHPVIHRMVEVDCAVKEDPVFSGQADWVFSLWGVLWALTIGPLFEESLKRLDPTCFFLFYIPLAEAYSLVKRSKKQVFSWRMLWYSLYRIVMHVWLYWAGCRFGFFGGILVSSVFHWLHNILFIAKIHPIQFYCNNVPYDQLSDESPLLVLEYFKLKIEAYARALSCTEWRERAHNRPENPPFPDPPKQLSMAEIERELDALEVRKRLERRGQAHRRVKGFFSDMVRVMGQRIRPAIAWLDTALASLAEAPARARREARRLQLMERNRYRAPPQEVEMREGAFDNPYALCLFECIDIWVYSPENEWTNDPPMVGPHYQEDVKKTTTITKKKSVKSARSKATNLPKAAPSKGLKNASWLLAQENPFLPACEGAKIPDSYSFPTQTSTLRYRVSVSGTSPNTFVGAAAFTPWSNEYYVQPAAVANSTAITWAGSILNPIGQQSSMAGVFSSYRVVSWGVKVSCETSLTNTSGHLLVCHVPQDLESDAAGFTSFPNSDQAVIDLPISQEIALSELCEDGLIVTGRRVDDGSLRFRDVAYPANASPYAETNTGWAAIVFVFVGASTQPVVEFEWIALVEGLQKGTSATNMVGTTVPCPLDMGSLEAASAIQQSLACTQFESKEDDAGTVLRRALRRGLKFAETVPVVGQYASIGGAMMDMIWGSHVDAPTSFLVSDSRRRGRR